MTVVKRGRGGSSEGARKARAILKNYIEKGKSNSKVEDDETDEDEALLDEYKKFQEEAESKPVDKPVEKLVEKQVEKVPEPTNHEILYNQLLKKHNDLEDKLKSHPIKIVEKTNQQLRDDLLRARLMASFQK